MKTRFAILTMTAALGLWSATASAADPIEGLFNTGVDDTGTVLFHGSRDNHYRLIDLSPVLGQPFVFTSIGAFPIDPWLADSATSAWIVPTSDGDANGPPGDYTFRIYMDLAGYDAGTVVVTGQWSTDNGGTDIFVNGSGTGNANSAQFVSWTPYTLSTVFSSGLNTIDFVLNNASTEPNPTGLRVEISGTGDRVPPGSPAFVLAGPTDTTVREGGTVVFTVSASGSYPVTYQWSRNGTPIQGATRAWLELADVRQAASGIYSVRVANPDGNESASATLTVTPTPIQVTRAPTLFVGGIVGRSYQVEVTEALSTAPLWDLFATVGPLTESPLAIPLEAASSQQFFRALEQP